MPTNPNNTQPNGTKMRGHIPEGYGTVTPFVIVRGAAQFLDFLQRAFNAEELGRVQKDGSIGKFKPVKP